MKPSEMHPDSSHTIEAERLASDAEEQGAFFWRCAGSPPGERHAYVDRELRERLVEALARVAPLAEWADGIAGGFDDAREMVGEAAEGIDDEALKRWIDTTDPEKFALRAQECISALCQALKAARAERGDAPAEEAVIARPAARKPSKLGASTASLPFIVTEVVVAANEVVTPKRGKKERAA